MDPQANLTQALAEQIPEDDNVSIADTLVTPAQGRVPVSEVIIPGTWDDGAKVDIAPSVPDILPQVRDDMLRGHDSKHYLRLREALVEVKDEYSLTLIDCPPSLDLLLQMSLAASDLAYIITHAARFSITGLARMTQTIEIVRQYYNHSLRIGGIIVNQFERQTLRGKFFVDELSQFAQTNDIQVLHPPVPKRTMVAEGAENAEALDQMSGTAGASDQIAEIYNGYLDQILRAAEGF
jgi:chromosome partitioning protein